MSVRAGSRVRTAGQASPGPQLPPAQKQRPREKPAAAPTPAARGHSLGAILLQGLDGTAPQAAGAGSLRALWFPLSALDGERTCFSKAFFRKNKKDMAARGRQREVVHAVFYNLRFSAGPPPFCFQVHPAARGEATLSEPTELKSSSSM